MEQQFYLKEYANLSLFEQARMTAEERSWWYKRSEREREAKAEAEKKSRGQRAGRGQPRQ